MYVPRKKKTIKYRIEGWINACFRYNLYLKMTNKTGKYCKGCAYAVRYGDKIECSNRNDCKKGSENMNSSKLCFLTPFIRSISAL